MTRRPALIALAAALGLTLPGCSPEVGYIYATYVSPTPTVVTIDCGDPYDVFENATKKLILVRSYAVSEAARGTCGAIGLRERQSLQERARRVAQAHLTKSNRPTCTVNSAGRQLSPLEWEYSYGC